MYYKNHNGFQPFSKLNCRNEIGSAFRNGSIQWKSEEKMEPEPKKWEFPFILVNQAELMRRQIVIDHLRIENFWTWICAINKSFEFPPEANLRLNST